MCRVTRLKYVRQRGADPGSVVKSRGREGQNVRHRKTGVIPGVHPSSFTGIC